MAPAPPSGWEPLGKGLGYGPLEPWRDGLKLLRTSSRAKGGEADPEGLGHGLHWAFFRDGGYGKGAGGGGGGVVKKGLLGPLSVL